MAMPRTRGSSAAEEFPDRPAMRIRTVRQASPDRRVSPLRSAERAEKAAADFGGGSGNDRLGSEKFGREGERRASVGGGNAGSRGGPSPLRVKPMARRESFRDRGVNLGGLDSFDADAGRSEDFQTQLAEPPRAAFEQRRPSFMKRESMKKDPSFSAASRGDSASSSSSESAVLQSPLPPVQSNLSPEELRESAYELLVGLLGSRPPAKVERSPSKGGVISEEMRAVLNLRATDDSGGSGSSMAPLDVVRGKLEVSEYNDMRTRKALTRAAAAQSGKRLEMLVVPLELLLELGPSDFSSQREYQKWRRRQLSLLEEGLLLHPARRRAVEGEKRARDKDKMEAAIEKVRGMLAELQSGKLDPSDPSSRSALKAAVAAVADKALPGSNPKFPVAHWADCFPLNLRLYALLLESIFSGPKESTLVGEVEEVLQAVGRAWPVLGICPLLHRAVFGWLFFLHFVNSGEKESALLLAAEFQLKTVLSEVNSSFKTESEARQAEQARLLLALLPPIVAHADRKLVAYHTQFPRGGDSLSGASMERMVGVAMTGEEVLQSSQLAAVVQREGLREVACGRLGLGCKANVETYVRTAVKSAFSKMREEVVARQVSFKATSTGAPPTLVALAADAAVLACDQVDHYAPLLKPHNSNAGGIAIATLHGCYREELKIFLQDRTLLTVETAQVLLQAEKLEKQLVEMAVEEGAESEDGGALVMQEMLPYETKKTMDSMLNKWMENRMSKFDEWVNRSISLERWEPKAMKAFCAPSVLDILGLLDEAQTAFFNLPVTPGKDMLVDLVKGMERSLMFYCKSTVQSVGSKDQFIPPLPPLTRFKKDVSGKHDSSSPTPPPSAASDRIHLSPAQLEKVALPRILVRINTLHHIHKEVDNLSSRIRDAWEKVMALPGASAGGNSGGGGGGAGGGGGVAQQKGLWPLMSFKQQSQPNLPLVASLPSELIDMFENVKSEADEGIATLCEFAGTRVIFYDLRDYSLHGLYSGGLGRARMGWVLEKLHPFLVTVSETTIDAMRDEVVASLLSSLVDVFLRVLLAGGPNRSYQISDAAVLDDDLSFLVDLFLDNGDGLPKKRVKGIVEVAVAIVNTMKRDTDDLIKEFEAGTKEPGEKGNSKQGVIRMPPIPEKWSPHDMNTLLRILCYRADRRASKYLKKIFDLPKEVGTTNQKKAPWY